MKNGFSIKSLDTYEWPVDVAVPVVNQETGEGEFEYHRFTGKFKHYSATEYEELVKRVIDRLAERNKKKEAAPDTESKTSTHALDIGIGMLDRATSQARVQIELYNEIWQGWGNDLTDQLGEPLPYDQDMKRKLLEEKIIRLAVIKAFNDSQAGEGARVKN